MVLEARTPRGWSAPLRRAPSLGSAPQWSEPQRWEPQRTALTALANGWLAEGATAVTISIGGIPVVSLPAGRYLPAGRRPSDGANREVHIAAPIHAEGRVAGEIRVTGAFGSGGLSKAARARVAAEAQLVGLLLETEADLASMTDQLIRTQDQLLAVYDLGQLARRPLGLGERVLALAEAGGRLLNVEGAAVVLAPDGRGRAAAAQYPLGAQDEAWLLTLLPLLADGAAKAGTSAADRSGSDRIGSSPEMAVLWQGRNRGDHTRQPPLPNRVESLLMVPIGTGEQFRGAFVFWSEQHERFASPDTKLAAAIAEQASVQIENALLQRDRIAQARLETELQLARGVQSNLLPKALPKAPGLDLYARTRPAYHVGGDFFDFVAGSAGSTVFLVGDVSGNGMSAALVMTMTRTMVRTILRSIVGQAQGDVGATHVRAASCRPAHGWALARGARSLPRSRTDRLKPVLQAAPGLQVASLLALVNAELFEDLTELSMFATAFVAQYHYASRCLVYANAGHSPVIYMPAGSPARLLEAGGPPIGVAPTLEYALPVAGGEQTLTFGPGDLLVAASDGFNEAHNADGEMFGLERLLRCVEEGAHSSAEALGQALFAAVEAFRGGEMQEDDQTVVIAKGA